ncbi:MAG TPA: hypothetical protein VHL57_06310 [Flavobacteriales bacterium]|jgi:hypothetical protein|nr:hypothetical protein [Flavobacteriales bacterium]
MQTHFSFIKRGVFLLLVTQGFGMQAQVLSLGKAVRPPDGWPKEQVEVYQPIVRDSTLLFGAPCLVWQCTCGAEEDVEFYYDIDFRCVRKCWGRKEVFDRVKVNGVYSFVQREQGQLYATLESRGDGFQYTELRVDSAGTAVPTRSSLWVLDTDHVVRTDTTTQFRYNSEELTTRLTRYVELIPMP